MKVVRGPSRRRVVVGLLVAGALVAGVAWWLGRPKPRPELPALTKVDPDLDSPYLNTRLEVRYFGDQACAGCHASIAKKYRQHPMGRSMAPVSAEGSLESYDAIAHNPFTALGSPAFRYLIEHRGAELLHREILLDSAGKPLSEFAVPVAYALGSGKQGRGYLIERGDGYLFESPVSWFTSKKAWDISPGYEHGNRHFARPITEDCLFCHANRVSLVPGSVNHYRKPLFDGLSIGCERCHGPGELHVQGRRTHEIETDGDQPDYTIVNPRRLDPVRRESVCQQCHFLGEVRIPTHGRGYFDYRPGLPYHKFVSGYTWVPQMADQLKAVNQTTQMHASRCFRESKGKMGCISCHDPHEMPKPAEMAGHYRQACLGCHTEQSCTLPPAVRRAKHPDDRCTDCHMPRNPSSDIAHSSVTDHSIPRVPRVPEKPPAFVLRPGQVPLVHFHRDLVKPGDPETPRGLGMALAEKAGGMDPDTKVIILERAVRFMDQARHRWPDDVPLLEAEGFALWTLGRLDEAAAVLERALQQAPERETALQFAACVAMSQQDNEHAIGHWQRLVRVNPWFTPAHDALGRIYYGMRRWEDAVRECREALRLGSMVVEVRMFLLGALVQLGNKPHAKEQYDILLRLNPPQTADMKKQFGAYFR